uniref:Uncharacterized protein n=1 Tax=Amphimedon queenslandica TaxID=400682 RepID=A0A1X7V4W1_AMPQE
MVSSINLTYIHIKMKHELKSNGWFGDKNILFVGDILQLPPVCGEPVFEQVTAKTLI